MTSPFLNDLAPRPSFTSRWPAIAAPHYLSQVSDRVHKHFQDNWPWRSSDEKEAYANQDMEHWALLICPDGPEERAELASAWVVFFFIYDDIVEGMGIDEAKEAVESMNQVIVTGRVSSNPFEAFAYDLRQKILAVGEQTTKDLAQKVFVETARYLSAAANHLERRKHVNAGFDRYLEHRILEGGFWFTMGLTLWQLDIVPTQTLLSDPQFLSLDIITGGHEMIINDMYSFQWEWNQFKQSEDLKAQGATLLPADHGYILYNAVTALLSEQDSGISSESGAMIRLGEYATRHEVRFEDTIGELKVRYRDGPEDLDMIEKVEKAHRDYMLGNLAWSIQCRRYNF